MTDNSGTETEQSGWPHDIDWDEHLDTTDEFQSMAEDRIEDGMHPEQLGQILHSLRGTFKGRAHDEAGPSGFHRRAEYRLFKVLNELAEDDEYDGSWMELSWILSGLEDLARTQARRERRNDE